MRKGRKLNTLICFAQGFFKPKCFLGSFRFEEAFFVEQRVCKYNEIPYAKIHQKLRNQRSKNGSWRLKNDWNDS